MVIANFKFKTSHHNFPGKLRKHQQPCCIETENIDKNINKFIESQNDCFISDIQNNNFGYPK